MKKINASFLLLFALLIVLAGCGSSENSNAEGENEGDKKTVKVLTNAAYAPMEYMDNNKPTGFDIDLINELATEAGYEVEIEHIGWDPLFIEIESERADIGISSITITEERQEKYDFSVPYYLSTNKILVPEASTITSGADLKDKVIAVQGGTTGMEIAEDILGKNHKDVKKFEENTLAIMELTKNGADAVIADSPIVEYYKTQNPNDKLKVIEDSSFASEYYGIMFAKGNTELKEDFDKALNTLFDNGKYEEIYEKWFGSKPDIENLKAQQ